MPVDINCDPSSLAQAAACYCSGERQELSEIVYLLKQIAGDDSMPSELARKSACFCSERNNQYANITYLLCQIANGGSGSVQDMQIAWEPGTLKLGESIGLFTTSNIPGLTKIEFLQSTSAQGIAINNITALSTADFPNLVSVDPTGTNFGNLIVSGCSVLTRFSAPNLVLTGHACECFSCPLLTTLDWSSLVSTGEVDCYDNASLPAAIFSALTTVAGDFYFNDNISATTLDVSSWVPTDGKLSDLSNCALNAASVELILRRFVLAGVTTCTIKLNGGTNAGLASLSPQGQADAATLGAQLTINP